MCYRPEVLFSCGCRETANSNLECCGGAIAYGIDCIGTMPAPAHRTLHVTIPCLDCRNNSKKQEKGNAASLLPGEGTLQKGYGGAEAHDGMLLIWMKLTRFLP
ncbi:hypothetical protein PG996_006478 [Apiospora saccharicola]|uniref:Uncharacterized protein n=1 Tax=Apiospora saccharicola TaxID=335842 RepID=A0ABR1VSJ1_9PEZI